MLGLPVENYKSYVEADATQRARHIPSNSFFLMHGLSDYSAPFLHGTKLARALTEAGVLFRYQVNGITCDKRWNLFNFLVFRFVLELRGRGPRTERRPGARLPVHGAVLQRLSQSGRR